jgi:aspartyl protease family protein
MIRTFGLAIAFAAVSVVSVQMLERQLGTSPAKAAMEQPGPSEFRGMAVLPEDGRGHFVTPALVNGIRIDSIIDTGASVIALSMEDATRIGIYPNKGDFKIPLSTANGSINAAPVVLREVRLGGILLNDVEAVVMPAGRLKTSLLGMSFLRRLSNFRVERGTLFLKE